MAGVGLWCTGTLSLLDASNQPFVVYNPYTYAELQVLAAGSDAYLECMSSKTYLPGETDCNPPTDNGPLQAQCVNVLTVLTACKANFLDSQWDQAAYILLNQSVFGQAVRAPYPDLALSASAQAVGACLADAQTRPACLDLSLNQSWLIPEVYWSYQDVLLSSSSPYVDACKVRTVFTGPAENPQLTASQQAIFQASLSSGSLLPHHLRGPKPAKTGAKITTTLQP